MQQYYGYGLLNPINATKNILLVHAVVNENFANLEADLTLCILVLSTDNLCKQFEPRSGLTKEGPDMDLKF